MDLRPSWAWCLENDRLSRQSGRYKNLLLDWIEKAVDEAGARAVARLTCNEWPRARLQARLHLLRALGLDPLPARTTPFLSRYVGTLERDGYSIERLVLEPRPHFLMPVHLYLPQGISSPAPAVLYAPGHWMIYGKTEPDIQACCIGLAKLGFVVLVFDPMGQGERGATFEDHARRDLLLLGLSQEGLMAWESMRAIDYLLTRPEVDGHRIGMTGASGGGLNTLYTCAVDERIAVSIPVCYVTSFSRFLRAMRGLNWNNANDLCNQVPNVIRDAETAGLCGLIHPRPLLVINGTLDPQFPVDGAQQVLEQLQDIYDTVGGERLRLTAVEAGHGYDRAMREAAYGWFRKWLQGEGDGSPVPEPPLTPEPSDSDELKCFLGTPSIRSWPAIRLLARSLGKALSQKTPALPDSEAAWERWAAAMRWALTDALGGGLDSADARGSVESREEARDGAERHLLEPEPGIVNPAFVVRPADASPAVAVIYFCDEGKLAGPGVDLLSAAIEGGAMEVAIDPRGIGETTPLPPPIQTVATLDGKLEYKESREGETLEFEAATDSLMLGRPLFGQQVADVLHAVRYVRGLVPHLPVILVGSGPICSLLALYAGALSADVAGVLADRLLPSYHLLVEEDQEVFPITPYVFGILRVADVPQVAALLAPRPLVITRSLGARLQEMTTAEASEYLRWTISAYRQRGAPLPTVLGSVSGQVLANLIAPTRP